MKRTLFKKIMGRIRFIPLILVSFLLLAFSDEARSQVSSAAFDPNCYFPRIGVPGEIDTIYGAHGGEYLGGDLLNIGPSIDAAYGEITFTDSNSGRPVFKSWPAFNLHKLEKTRNLYLNKYYKNYQFGHFHSPKYLDILATEDGEQLPARIYWQDDNGNYDSTRYTALLTALIPKNGNDYSPMNPFTGRLSSDSVDDIIYSVWVNNRYSTGDSVYLLFFKGGENLKSQGQKAYADSTVFFDTLQSSIDGKLLRKITKGDFRGVGRQDIIATEGYHNFFYYRNDTPFTLAGVVKSMKYDTLYAQWQNPKSLNNFHGEDVVMSVLSKSQSDSSNDFLAFFTTTAYPQRAGQDVQEYRIFRGGKDFGNQRWTAESAEYVIHEPYYYDLNYHSMSFAAFGAIRDCGHMTGTKNHVLYIEGLLDGGFYGYEFFYVLGDAIDDKVDMFIGPFDGFGSSGNYVDTIVADNDKLQDIIMGHPQFGPDANGSVHVVHGSKMIPERTRSVTTGKPGTENISLYPNPVTDGKFTIDLSSIEQQNLTIEVWDLLGRRVYSEYIGEAFMRQSHRVIIPLLSSGTYILEITGKNFTKRMDVHVLK